MRELREIKQALKFYEAALIILELESNVIDPERYIWLMMQLERAKNEFNNIEKPNLIPTKIQMQ